MVYNTIMNNNKTNNIRKSIGMEALYDKSSTRTYTTEEVHACQRVIPSCISGSSVA